VAVDAYGVYTNNPPCGAMRGFGAVQACFAYESQMDKLATAVDLSPVELRTRNALTTGSVMPTGQIVEGPAPVAELLARVRDRPPAPPATDDPRERPGGVSNTTRGEGVVRGVGYAIGIKNVCFSEGFDDYATARVRLEVIGGEPAVLVHTAAAEVGQGLVTVQAQIARTELGVERVTVATADTSVGSAGSSSASRQTYMTGGAVRAACLAVRDRLLARAGLAGARLAGGKVVSASDDVLADLVDLIGDEPVEETVEWRHRPTHPLDPATGQGDAHVQYAFAAHRATVDVDVELGLVRVVEIVTAQDVGKAVNPQAVVGQIHGGTAQGIAEAMFEEAIYDESGNLLTSSMHSYRIPSAAELPPFVTERTVTPSSTNPMGVKGVGEAATIAAPPAVVNAVVDALLPLGVTHIDMPVTPERVWRTIQEAKGGRP
jgi:CO/xanthine dehydrogenase Mo-binding subunit